MTPPLLPPAGGPVRSPCINVCRMDDARGWCVGCLRTLDEIGAWSAMSEAQRAAVLAELSQRREAAAVPPNAPG